MASLESGVMSHRVQSAMLVLALLWQAISMVNPFAGAPRADQFEHLVVFTHVAHQANEDRFMHENASASHLHTDEGLMLAGLILTLALGVPSVPRADLIPEQAPRYSPPSLDGLLRPPMALA